MWDRLPMRIHRNTESLIGESWGRGPGSASRGWADLRMESYYSLKCLNTVDP